MHYIIGFGGTIISSAVDIVVIENYNKNDMFLSGGDFMKCIHCENEMTKANLTTIGGLLLETKTSSIFETPEISKVEVYVCNKCGYVELKATDFKKF